MQIAVFAAQFPTLVARRRIISTPQVPAQLTPIVRNLGLVVAHITTESVVPIPRQSRRNSHPNQQQNPSNRAFDHIVLLPHSAVSVRSNTVERQEFRRQK